MRLRRIMMKRIICKFASWLLRKCTDTVIEFGDDIYINGDAYELVEAEHEMTAYEYDTIHFTVRTKR